MRQLKAFRLGVPLYKQARELLGDDHAATCALRQMLEQLACGCHRFDSAGKAAAYRDARDAASRAACELVLAETDAGDALVRAIEQELMAALAGILRRIDRPRGKRERSAL